MLKKIIKPSGLLKSLIKDKLIEEAYLRKNLSNIDYYDVVPLLNENILEELNIPNQIHVGRKGFDFKKVMDSCAGETLERMSLMRIFKKQDFIEKKVDLTSYFSKEELIKHNISSQKLGQLISLKNVFSKKNEYVLADLIIPNIEIRAIPKFSSSVGAAFYKTTSPAVMGGLLELIERHSILQAWYLDKNIPRIKNLPKRIKKITQNIEEKLHLKISFYSLCTEIECPVICCKLDFGKNIVFGCCADLNTEIACQKALSESLQLWVSSKFIHKIKQKDSLEKRFTKLIKNPLLKFSYEDVPFPANSSKFKLYAFFKKNNMKILYINITPKKLKKYGCAVKVFCPDLLQFQNNLSLIYKSNEFLLKTSTKEINPFV